jgi:hypothetical protein
MAYVYNTTNKTAQVTATSTARALHDDIQTTFTGSTYMQYLIPNSGSIKDALYVWQNGWTFLDATSIGYMTTGGWIDSTGDNKWTNVKGISGDTFTGIQLYYNQTGTPTNFGATGLPNMILKVRDAGTDVASQAYTVYQRTFQKKYSQFATTASAGGVDTIPLTVSADPLLDIASGTLDTYSDMSITWGTVSEDVGDGDGANNYAISIVTTNAARTLKEIYNWVQYKLTSASDIDSGAGTHVGKITDALLEMAGSTMTTKQGVWVEGFAATDANNIIYTDSAGDTHTPPLSVAVTVNFDAAVTSAGGQVAVFTLDTPSLTDATYTPANIATTFINEAATGTSASDTMTYTVDVPVRVLVRAPGLQQFSLYTTITSAGLTVQAQTPTDSAY